MRTILVTNDDGIDSPTLVPLVRALQPLGQVQVVVPAVERSWIGKAITRFDAVKVVATERDGIAMHTVTGAPADCVNLAVHTLLAERPDIVVSGVNIGLNFGLAFLLSSGTVGAAMEAWIAGLPSIAFSTALPHDAYGLAGLERMEALGNLPQAAAAVSTDIAATLLREGFPADVDTFTVNMPADVGPTTPREITRVTRSRYGALFAPTADGSYRHRFQSYWAIEEPDDGDMAVVNRGAVAITPLRFDFSAALPAGLRAALEKRAPRA